MLLFYSSPILFACLEMAGRTALLTEKRNRRMMESNKPVCPVYSPLAIK